jgi:hypothetical protein
LKYRNREKGTLAGEKEAAEGVAEVRAVALELLPFLLVGIGASRDTTLCWRLHSGRD